MANERKSAPEQINEQKCEQLKTGEKQKKCAEKKKKTNCTWVIEMEKPRKSTYYVVYGDGKESNRHKHT